MSIAQEQIVHTIIEGFKEQRIDALDWMRHKILGALINEANAGEATCRQMILDAVDLKDGAISARDAEIARLRDELNVLINAPTTMSGTFNKKRVDWLKSRARAALEASHDAKPEGK